MLQRRESSSSCFLARSASSTVTSAPALYAPFAHDGISQQEVVGLISLMVWTLTIIVTFKYVLFLLRADNDGEGGTLSLLALLMKKTGAYRPILFFAGIIGAALFIGDAMITPALSVMSALKGLKLVTPALADYVLAMSAAIMVALFLVQSKGTAAVSNFFGFRRGFFIACLSRHSGTIHPASRYRVVISASSARIGMREAKYTPHLRTDCRAWVEQE